MRPGDYVFPGTPIAVQTRPLEETQAAILAATALGADRVSSGDLEYAVRQLVEVAVRALSPGINDPHTAISVLDRLGASLCDVVDLHLPSNVWLRDGRTVLALPGIEYGGLLDAMFHQIRQNAAGDASVLIRLLEVLTAVASREKNPDRVDELSRHAELVLADAERDVPTEADRVDLRGRHGYFHAMRKHGPLGPLGALGGD